MTTSTQFFKACEEGDLEKIKTIIQAGKLDINTKSPEGWTGLIIACFNEHIDIVRILINQGANVNATNNKGTSVLMYAKTPVLENQEKTNILELLLHSGSNINHLDCHKKSVLDYVMEKKTVILTNWLRSKGAKSGSAIVQCKSQIFNNK